MTETSTIVAILAILPGIVFIVSSLIIERDLRKKNASQRISLVEYGQRIKDLEYEVWQLYNVVKNGKRYDSDDIARAYMSSSICRYCKMPLIPGEHVCKSCGALVVSADTIWLWRGK